LSPISYPEAGYTPASNYNDGKGDLTSAVPRALVAGDNLSAAAGSTGDEATNLIAGTDYLAIKGTSLGLNSASQKWSYMPYSSGVTGKKRPRIWASNNLTNSSDRVIVLKKSYNEKNVGNQLIYNTSTPTIYWARYYTDGWADTAFNPTLREEVYYIYGIKSDADDLRMPFNRADYFVARPTTTSKVPAYCAAETGILYKGVVSHGTTGGLNYVPVMDCVADMQVIFGWDVDDGMGNEGQDGLIDTYSTPCTNPLAGSSCTAITVSPSTNQTRVTTAMSDPEKLRKSLKLVKVYLLSQVGRRDPNYQSPASFVLGDAASDYISKTYNLTANQMNYRWKVYRIVVRPKNLDANQ